MDDRTNRRCFLIGGLAGGLVSMLPAAPARATPAEMKAAIRRVIGEAPLRKGKVTLDLPPIVENGNTVSLDVTVDNPMTADNHVTAIHIFNEKNPQPNVISMKLGPRAGRGRVSTRMRLADSQTVVAIAELSDGSFWSDQVDVVVTIAACLEEPV